MEIPIKYCNVSIFHFANEDNGERWWYKQDLKLARYHSSNRSLMCVLAPALPFELASNDAPERVILASLSRHVNCRDIAAGLIN